jgi:hypothetical protein
VTWCPENLLASPSMQQIKNRQKQHKKVSAWCARHQILNVSLVYRQTVSKTDTMELNKIRTRAAHVVQHSSSVRHPAGSKVIIVWQSPTHTCYPVRQRTEICKFGSPASDYKNDIFARVVVSNTSSQSQCLVRSRVLFVVLCPANRFAACSYGPPVAR